MTAGALVVAVGIVGAGAWAIVLAVLAFFLFTPAYRDPRDQPGAPRAGVDYR